MSDAVTCVQSKKVRVLSVTANIVYILTLTLTLALTLTLTLILTLTVTVASGCLSTDSVLTVRPSVEHLSGLSK